MASYAYRIPLENDRRLCFFGLGIVGATHGMRWMVVRVKYVDADDPAWSWVNRVQWAPDARLGIYYNAYRTVIMVFRMISSPHTQAERSVVGIGERCILLCASPVIFISDKGTVVYLSNDVKLKTFYHD